MRGLLQPLLIVAAVCMLALALASLGRAVGGGPVDTQPLPYACTQCRGPQVIDSDLLVWKCQWCGAWHWAGQGRQPEHWSPVWPAQTAAHSSPGERDVEERAEFRGNE